jgi:hypothetical protein
MNDIFVVQLFSLNSLVALLKTESDMNVLEIGYVLSFAIWHAVIAIIDLTRKVRLDMLELVSRVFVKWYALRLNSPIKKMKDPVSTSGWPGHFVAEPMDLMRYMNSVVFLRVSIRINLIHPVC